MSTPRSNAWRTADRVLGGELASLLVEWRADGHSYNDITGILRDRGIVTTPQCVSNWCRAVGIPPAKRVGAR